MRLLFVTDRYPPYLVGGYEVLCHDVVRRLAARGHECLVLTSDYRATGREREPGVIRRLHLPHTSPRLLQHAWWERADAALLRRCVAEFRPDLVSTWSMLWLFGSLHRIIREFQVPVLANLHGLWIKTHLHYHRAWCDAWARPGGNAANDVIKRALRHGLQRLDRDWARPLEESEIRLDHAVFGSEFTRQEYLEAGIRLPDSRVIYSGIDTRSFTSRPLPARPSELSLLYLGRLVPEKGAHVAIDAVGLLVARGRPVRLTIVGIPGYPFDYAPGLREQVARLGLEAAVAFGDPVANDRLPETYAAHEVFLFPSWHREATSMALLGAMSCGRAVVSTAIGGSSEVLRDENNALVVPAGDPEALAASIERLLDEPGLARRLGAAARETIVSRFDLETVTSQMEAYVTQLTSRPAGLASDSGRG